jgi:hypothetical protein
MEGMIEYITPAGSTIWSSSPCTLEELQRVDEYEAYYATLPEANMTEEEYQEYQEDLAADRDSDGYGWERKALGGIY